MKLFSIAWCFFLSTCFINVHANANANMGVTDCSSVGSSSCDVFLKMKRHIDDVSYKVELADAENGEKIFPYFDMNETTEIVSLQKHGERYVFLKEYFDSTKAMEFITFKYENKTVLPVRYYYIESSIDFNNNLKEWSGKECGTPTGKLPEQKDGLLLQIAAGLCVNKIKLAYIHNRQVGSDILFYLSQIINGVEKKQVSVIALDSKDVDYINLNNIGCLWNCDVDFNSINYIGRLNEKLRIGLHLEFNNDEVSGFYFYEKNKGKINVTGHRIGKRLTLLAYVPEGIERFDGVLENGKFEGVWSNAVRNKKYRFDLYMRLIQ